MSSKTMELLQPVKTEDFGYEDTKNYESEITTSDELTSSGTSEDTVCSFSSNSTDSIGSRLQIDEEKETNEDDFFREKPDDYVFCRQCNDWIKSDCGAHPTEFLENVDQYMSIKNGVQTVAVQRIPMDVMFGPFEGRTVDVFSDQQFPIDIEYLWEINTFSKTSGFRRLLQAESNQKHWSNLITGTAENGKPNVYAVQFRGEIYFRSLRDIEKDETLFVEYGDRFGSFRGRPIDGLLSSNLNKPKKRTRKSKALHRRPMDLLYKRLAINDTEGRGVVDGWRCRFCPFETTVYSRMRYHAKTAHEHPKKRHICKVCSKELATATSLRKHIIIHDTNSKKFLCTKCGMDFRLGHHLRRHESSVHGVGEKAKSKTSQGEKKEAKIYTCVKCEKQFTTKQSASRHTKTVHEKSSSDSSENGPAKQTFKCTSCEKVLTSSAGFKLHLQKVHSKEEVRKTSHVCYICTKSFHSNPELRYHLMRHTGKFPFYCQICKLGYPSRSELKKHQLRSRRCSEKKNSDSTSGNREEQTVDVIESV